MKHTRFLFPALLLCVLVLGSFTWMQTLEKLSIHMEVERYTKGKKALVKADVYYQVAGGKMLTNYNYPVKYVTIANSKGELKMYYPEANEVMQMTGAELSTDFTHFYYFLSANTNDLGLTNMGFAKTSTQFEDGAMVTKWMPQASYNLPFKVGYVELVHENYNPIYMAYHDDKGGVMRKVFYYEYQQVNHLMLPMKVAEYVYTEEGDSVVTRSLYSDIKINNPEDGDFFNFKIPADAKVIDQEK